MRLVALLVPLLLAPALQGVLEPAAPPSLPAVPDVGVPAVVLAPTAVFVDAGLRLRESFRVPGLESGLPLSSPHPPCEVADAGTGWDDAHPLSWPTTCTGTLNETGDDFDLYAIELDADDYVVVTLDVPEDADFDLCIYREWWEDEMCTWFSGNWTERVEGGLVEGRWFVGVYHYEGSGEYVLDVQASSPPGPQDDCASGGDAADSRRAPTSVPFPVACAGALRGSDHVDWYGVELAAGAYLAFDVLPNAFADFDACVFAPTGETYACSFNDGPGVAERILVATEDLAGTWVVGVGVWHGYGGYALDGAPLPAPAPQDDCGSGRDASWRIGNATVVAYPVACDNAFDDFDRLDWFALALTADEEYVGVDVAPAAGVAVGVCTVDPSGRVVECAEAADGTTARARGGGEAGTWRIAVYAAGPRGAYHLDVATLDPPFPAQDDCGLGTDAGERAATAGPAPFPTVCEGLLHELDRYDWYNATTPSDTWVAATVRVADGGGAWACAAPAAESPVCRWIEGEGHVYAYAGASAWTRFVVARFGNATGYELELGLAPPPPVQDDCGSGGDAQDWWPPAPIEAPGACSGLLARDYGDWRDRYGFRSNDIDGFRARLTTDAASGMTLCINSPMFWDETCATTVEGVAVVDLYAPGAPWGDLNWWTIEVAGGSGAYDVEVVGVYRTQYAGGGFVVGHSVTEAPVASTVGPTPYFGVDGFWIRLGEVAKGDEHFDLDGYAYTGADAVPEGTYHDADGDRLEGVCPATGEACAVPAGAAWVFVTARSGTYWQVWSTYRYLDTAA